MSQQAPLLVIADAGRPSFAAALEEAQMFPLIDADFSDAARAVVQVHPAAVLADMTSANQAHFAALAMKTLAQQPYLPLIAVGSEGALTENAIPFRPHGGSFDRLPVRLRAALRVRALHSTVLRRLGEHPSARTNMLDIDPARDATVLLLGRDGSYPALSVALGERMGVVGAFSVEAAANHLNNRDIDGIVLGEGFSPRVADAFLTVLSENARFRHLPIVLTSDGLDPSYDLPNLEIICGEPAQIAASALPLIRQHAIETQLSRTLRAVEAQGLLDPTTGLLTPSAFNRDLATAVRQTQSDGGGLSVARFAFDPQHPRAQLDGARIISRLMRKMDFGALQSDCSVIVVFADTDLRAAHGAARRLSAVMRHTAHGKRGPRSSPRISVATLLPADTPKSLLARLHGDPHREAV